MALSAWLLALACGEGLYGAEQRALAAYTRGQEALEAGQGAAAAQAFAEASQHDPRSAELHLWRARALAQQGDLDGAAAAAGQALALRPGWPLALYNRGCWRARQGLLELAWADLEPALRSGELDPLAVAADPDLDPLRLDARWAGRVPAAELPAELALDPGPRFLHDDLRLIVVAPVGPGQQLELHAEGPVGLPLSLRRVVEVEEPAGAGRQHRLEFSLRVEGAAEGVLGPLTARVGALTRTLPPAPLQLLAPEGHRPRALPPLELPVPSAWFAGVPASAGAPQGAWLLVRGLPGDTLTWARPPAVLALVEHRVGAVPDWIGWAAWDPDPLRATLQRGAVVVWEGPG